MTFFRYAVAIYLSIIIYSHTALALVDCNSITDWIESGSIPEAANLVDTDSNVDPLCAFYVAWAWRDEPDKAHPYIERIKDSLNKREPFYYQALYLKLLLLELNHDEIRRALNKLSNAEPKLAQKLKSKHLENFKQLFQKLLNDPFNTTIEINSPWLENTPEKEWVEEILALVKNIREKNQIRSINLKNSQEIKNFFDELKRVGANIEQHEILARHTDYINYFNFRAIAQNKNKSLSVRLENAEKAFKLVQKHQANDNNAAENLLKGLQWQQETAKLEKMLVNLLQELKKDKHPAQLDLNPVRKYWNGSSSVAQALKDKNDVGFLELLKCFDNCYHQNQLDSCQTLADWNAAKPDHLRTNDIKPFKTLAKDLLSKRAKDIKTQVEMVIYNGTGTYTIESAYREAKRLLDKNKSTFEQYLPSNEYKELKTKVATLEEIKIALSLAGGKNWTEIKRLSKELGITNKFKSLRKVDKCLVDQQAIKETEKSISKKDDIQQVIQDCHQTLSLVYCSEGTKSVRSNLVKTVAQKIIVPLKSVSDIDNTIDNLAVLLSDTVPVDWMPQRFENKNHCKAESPLDTWISDTKSFLEGLKTLVSKKQKRRQNQTEIEQMLALYPSVKELINVDARYIESLVVALSVSTPPTDDGKSDDTGNESKNAGNSPTGKRSWSWKKSFSRSTLLANEELRKKIQILRDDKKYPYFVVGMAIWTDDKSSQDYLRSDSTHYYQLVKTIKTLMDSIDSPNNQVADFQPFYNIVDVGIKNDVKEEQREKIMGSAHFAGTFFQGLWYLERHEYQSSYDVIHKAFCIYKYTPDMNTFSKKLIKLIVYLGEDIQKTTCNSVQAPEQVE